jgi:putative hydrolase of the HAD superfamily
MAASPPLNIKTVAFDLGNVLVKADHRRFCRGLGRLAGQSPEEIYAALFETDLEPAFDTGRISSREFYRQVRAKVGVALPYADFELLWNDIFAPMADMEGVVARLQGRYPLFLLSNTNPLHFEYLQEHFPQLLRPFQAFILSYRVGSRKPEAGIYQALIQQAGHPAERILYLDDLPPLVEAARGQGLTAWLFTTPGDLQQRLDRHGL